MRTVLLIAFIAGVNQLFAQQISLPTPQDLCIKHQVYEGYEGSIVSCSLYKNSSSVFSFRLIHCDSLLHVKHDSLLYFTGVPMHISQGISKDKQFFYFLALNYNHSVTTVAIDLSGFEITSAYTPVTNNFDFNFSGSQIFQIDSKFFLFGHTKETPSILEVDAQTAKQFEIYPHGIGPNSLLKSISQAGDSTLKITYSVSPQLQSTSCMYWQIDAYRSPIEPYAELPLAFDRIPTQIEALPHSTNELVLYSNDGESLRELCLMTRTENKLNPIKTIDLLNETAISYFLTEKEKSQLKKAKRKNKVFESGLYTTINHIAETDSSYIAVLELYRQSTRVESHYGNSEYKNTYLVQDGKNYVALVFMEINKKNLDHHFTAIPIQISPKPFSENSLVHFTETNNQLCVRVLSTTGAYDFRYANKSIIQTERFNFKLPINPSNEYTSLPTALGLTTQNFVYAHVQTVRGANEYLVNNLNSYIQVFQFALPPFP